MSLQVSFPEKLRKIIHIDMDCFYAAIEIRDNPQLADKPVAVGGPENKRGVICTSNYIARRYGVRSAMATVTAYRHCKDLVLLPVNMAKYKQVAQQIHAIFHEFTDLVEPLALDEAYLDVTAAVGHQGSATLMAKAIRQRIWETQQLTASAGVAPNKFLAKIASGWKKPNGLFVIRPGDVEAFIQTLPIDKLFGVGKVTATKLHDRNIKTCADLQKISLTELTANFGKLGLHLYEQCRGIDHRQVQPNRTRKSLSVERTFPQDVSDVEYCLTAIKELYVQLNKRIQESAVNLMIKNQYLKIKFNDFKLTSVESACHQLDLMQFIALFRRHYAAEKPIRLLGIGVHFCQQNDANLQQTLF